MPSRQTIIPNHPGWGPLWRGLVCDPGAKHYKRLKNGCLWLFLYVIASAAHRTGKLVTTWSKLAEETGLSEWHLRSMAGHLRTKGYVNLYPQGEDHILFVVNKWKPLNLRWAKKANGTEAQEGQEDGWTRKEIPDRPQAPPLAREVAAALGAKDQLEEIAELVTAYPEGTIRRFMEQALAVPTQKIRVSRYALFKWLLKNHDQGVEIQPGSGPCVTRNNSAGQ